jgi:glutamine---fructose-6-phosphate transaminase (isomerizing)
MAVAGRRALTVGEQMTQTPVSATPATRPGAIMRAEIAEQPDVLSHLLDRGLAQVRDAAAAIGEARPRFVLFAARGTSDHAALYAKYLVEVRLGLPAGLASPSTMTVYGARPDLRHVLVVAVSQSGGSPDLVESATVARDCGATVLAVTNAPQSDLARAADLHVDVMAGAERAVAATKSYTAEMLSLWLVLDAWAGGDAAAAYAVPPAVAGHVARFDEMASLAERYRFTDRMLLTGRGYAYPTAREGALKLMETSYVAAHAFSGADLLHGPLAMLDAGHPVVAVVPDGVSATAMHPVLERLRERGTDLAVLGGPSSTAYGTVGVDLDHGLPEELAPIADIVLLQQLALVMATGRGHDPDSPRGLSKVTRTW